MSQTSLTSNISLLGVDYKRERRSSSAEPSRPVISPEETGRVRRLSDGGDDFLEVTGASGKRRRSTAVEVQRIEKAREAFVRFSLQPAEILGPKTSPFPKVETKSVQTDLTWAELEYLFESVDTESLEDMRNLIARLKKELIKRRHTLVPDIHFEMESDTDEEDDVFPTEDVEKKVSFQQEDKDNENEMLVNYASKHKRDSLAITPANVVGIALTPKGSIGMVANPITRRVNSAHCIGKETFLNRKTIFDLYKNQGEEAVKVEPKILKYVGEKEPMKPSVTDIRSKSSNSENIHITGWDDGICQFCNQKMKDLPTMEQLKDPELSSDIEYCCQQFKMFMQLNFENVEKYDDVVEDVLIDITPNAPFGSPSSRKAAAARLEHQRREKELEKQKAAAQQANLFAFARQMKTIQYSLSSAKCMNEGWTIKPITPLPPDTPKEEPQFEVNSTILQSAGVLIEKTYGDGRRFVTIFPDGTGCLYYPSGNAAVVISSTEKRKFSYYVQIDKRYEDLEDSGLLAIFEPNGHSVTFFKKTKRIKTFINAHGGMEMDRKGRRKKRWKWCFGSLLGQTPLFHPIYFTLNKCLSVRILDQNNIVLTFSSHNRCVRFNVGSHIKALPHHTGEFEADESEKFLKHQKAKITPLLEKIHTALRLPKSAREGTYPTFKTRKKKLNKVVGERLAKVKERLPSINDSNLLC